MPPADAEECKIDTDTHMLDDIDDTIILRKNVYDKNIVELVEIVMGDVNCASTKEAAKDMYVDFLEKLDNLI